MLVLSTAKAGSCLGQQTSGGSKPVTVTLPTFPCQSHGDWAACSSQACGPRCVSQRLRLCVHCLPGSSNGCPSTTHSPGIIRHRWRWQLSQLWFCPLHAFPRQWIPTVVASPWGGKIERRLYQQRALNWLCRKFIHVRSALFLQMRLRFFSPSYSLEKFLRESTPTTGFSVTTKKSFEWLWGMTLVPSENFYLSPNFFFTWIRMYICVCGW